MLSPPRALLIAAVVGWCTPGLAVVGGLNLRPEEPKPTPIAATVPPAQPPARATSCLSHRRLADLANTGRLTHSDLRCLEHDYRHAKPEMANAASEMLILGAERTRNMAHMERLVKRHLERFEDTEPHLTLRWANCLSGYPKYYETSLQSVQSPLDNSDSWTKRIRPARRQEAQGLVVTLMASRWTRDWERCTTNRTTTTVAALHQSRAAVRLYAHRMWDDCNQEERGQLCSYVLHLGNVSSDTWFASGCGPEPQTFL